LFRISTLDIRISPNPANCLFQGKLDVSLDNVGVILAHVGAVWAHVGNVSDAFGNTFLTINRISGLKKAFLPF
jgi:hypothetical protein